MTHSQERERQRDHGRARPQHDVSEGIRDPSTLCAAACRCFAVYCVSFFYAIRVLDYNKFLSFFSFCSFFSSSSFLSSSIFSFFSYSFFSLPTSKNLGEEVFVGL